MEYQLTNYFFIVRMLNMGPASKEMILNFVAEQYIMRKAYSHAQRDGLAAAGRALDELLGKPAGVQV